MVLECAQAAAAQETIAVFNSPMELHCLGGGKEEAQSSSWRRGKTFRKRNPRAQGLLGNTTVWPDL
jgi:hypothetical protein